MTNNKQQTNFQVYSLQTIDESKENKYVHWADGLTMYIVKDNVTMILDEKEIQQLIKALPKTVGGTY
jgi:hypothetical protein